LPARRARKPTPEQALRSTQALLAAHNEQARQVPAWRQLEGGHEAPAVMEGAQSPEAAARQQELHLAETRAKAIQGSSSTRDRRTQRRRDQR